MNSEKTDRMCQMAELPVPEVLIRMSLPMMISFFIQAMYNIVDSIFVARISENAFTAVSLAFPMQQIVTAIAVGTATGVSAVWSRYMGMGKRENASAAIRTMTTMGLLFTALFLFLGLFASRPLFRLQTDVQEIGEMGTVYLAINWCFSCGTIFGKYYERLLVSAGRSVLSMAAMASGAIFNLIFDLFRLQTDVQEIGEMGTVYLAINWCFSCGTIFGKYYERLLVSAGRSVLSMAAMASGAIFNLIFDPLLIFGIGPFPELGIAGAAYATVGGQIFAVLVAIALNRKYNPAVRQDMLRPGFSLSAAGDILRVGLPSIITMGLSSLTSFFINQILLVYSTTATAVYGIWMKLQNFCYMPTYGLNNGIVPILSYNYGIRRTDRVNQTMRLAVWGSAALMCLLLVILELVPQGILTLFSAGEQMREIGLACLRVCVTSLPFGAASMVLSTSMQALDHSRYAMLINILRQCALLIFCFFALSLLTHNLKWVWLAVPVTELVTFAVSMELNRRFRRRLFPSSGEVLK